MMQTPPPSALGGYRVLDLAGEAGAYGTKVLADLGAEVILVEPPSGSRMRRLPPLAQNREGGAGSLYFATMNTNKLSISLDLEKPEGQGIFRRLAGWADAIVETSQPGWMAERGIGYDLLAKSNPKLVWVALTPFGLTGPRRDWQGSDLVGWASSGVLNLNGFPGEAPLCPGGSAMLGYALGALNAAVGCLLALHSADQTEQGQLVDVSMQEAVLTSLSEAPVGGFLDDLIPRRRFGSRRIHPVPHGIFPCKDGHVKIAIIQPAHWLRIARWINEKTGNEAVTDPLFEDWHLRTEMKQQIEQWTEVLTLQYNKQEFFREAQSRGLPITPVNTVADLLSDPQLAARSYWSDIDDPVLGRLRLPGAPYRLSETPWQPGRAPELAEHNQAIYADALGMTQEELQSLRSGGVI